MKEKKLFAVYQLKVLKVNLTIPFPPPYFNLHVPYKTTQFPVKKLDKT